MGVKKKLGGISCFDRIFLELKFIYEYSEIIISWLKFNFLFLMFIRIIKVLGMLLINFNRLGRSRLGV